MNPQALSIFGSDIIANILRASLGTPIGTGR